MSLIGMPQSINACRSVAPPTRGARSHQCSRTTATRPFDVVLGRNACARRRLTQVPRDDVRRTWEAGLRKPFLVRVKYLARHPLTEVVACYRPYLSVRQGRSALAGMGHYVPAAAEFRLSGMSHAVLEPALTCPVCGHAKIETMPTDACQWFYQCAQCQTVLHPTSGDCCVYCSYGSVPCPPVQERRAPVSTLQAPRQENSDGL